MTVVENGTAVSEVIIFVVDDDDIWRIKFLE